MRPRSSLPVLFAAVLCAAGLPGPLLGREGEQAPASEAREARLTMVEGSVYLHLSGHPDGEYIAAEADSALDEGDHVRTGTDGQAEIALDGDSVIALSANSDFILRSLDPAQTEFELAIGSLLGKLRSLLGGQSMLFRTPTAVAAVRGTEFALSQEEDDEPARVGVFDEGQVSVRAEGQEEEVALGPGQETQVFRGRAPARPEALKFFLTRRALMARAVRRREALRKSWAARSPARRAALRARLMKRATINGQKLRNVREDFRRRTYQRRQERLRQRQERRNERRERGPRRRR